MSKYVDAIIGYAIGTVTSSMAGIIYGYNSIPKEWLNDLIKRNYLIELSTKYENKILGE